jgi:hypothetical protein
MKVLFPVPPADVTTLEMLFVRQAAMPVYPESARRQVRKTGYRDPAAQAAGCKSGYGPG